ncbi:MAG: pitrilysin family protein, partial [Gammaproteobacteria bacterium]|nr:pitrilysin family protein [Gammaproteobacteria bacterium]
MRVPHFLPVIFLAVLGNALASPSIEQWQTGQEVRTLFVAAPELPMLDIAVTFGAGSDRDARLAGLSQLTHGLLSAGSGALDADAIAEKFEDVGAQFGVSVDLDHSRVSLRSLNDERLLEQALSTFVEVLARPAFPERDFLRLKNQALTAIHDEQQRPDSIARKAFYQAVFGDHPYAQSGTGSESSVQAIALDDVKRFHRQFMVAENAMIAIVGAVDTDRARQIAERIASNLPRGARAPPTPPPPPAGPD